MFWRVDLSAEATKQLSSFPPTVRARLIRAIDELEQRDDSQWSNVKALQGSQWKGRFRKRVGAYRVVFRKFPDRSLLEVSAILIKSEDTYR
jgi:mRNA-degrading endonuclease RelE of RelBE toxin-antitoxin system